MGEGQVYEILNINISLSAVDAHHDDIELTNKKIAVHVIENGDYTIKKCVI